MENIIIILKSSEYYPKKLLSLKQPPEFLFALGNLKLLNTFSVGIVGARACTEESIVLTKQLVTELSIRGITILSGMADGIDQIAHEACLKAHGKTIAILGAGFDTLKKQKIFTEILNNNGLILTEYFPDIPAFRYNFPRRNQILVSISNSIVAVETHLKSGTMITASEALSQNVPLFTFPGGVNDTKYLGNNLLLTKGAICINSYSDIIKNLKTIYPEEKFNLRKSLSSYESIPEKYKDIYSLLSKIPTSINIIAQKLNLSLKDVQSKLTLMELDDLATKLSNNCYIKKI